MEERFTTTGTTPWPPVTASDQTYGPGNTRPEWVDQLPDPDDEARAYDPALYATDAAAAALAGLWTNGGAA